MHLTTTPERQISPLFALWSAVFDLQAILRQVQRITPKSPGTLKGQRYDIYIWQISPLPPSPTFNPSCPTASHFQFSGHFETSVTDDNKIVFNTKRSNVSHMHMITTPKSKISLLFALWPAVFELESILRQVQMTSKCPWTLKGQRKTGYPICTVALRWPVPRTWRLL